MASLIWVNIGSGNGLLPDSTKWWPQYIKILNSNGNAFSINGKYIWVRLWRCSCLATWFCFQVIAKPGNKTAASLWPDWSFNGYLQNCVYFYLKATFQAKGFTKISAIRGPNLVDYHYSWQPFVGSFLAILGVLPLWANEHVWCPFWQTLVSNKSICIHLRSWL